MNVILMIRQKQLTTG